MSQQLVSCIAVICISNVINHNITHTQGVNTPSQASKCQFIVPPNCNHMQYMCPPPRAV